MANLLDEQGIECYRMRTRGWGYLVSQAAVSSSDRAADAAKAGYGWVECVPPHRPAPCIASQFLRRAWQPLLCDR